MPQLLTCPRGHRWDPGAAGGPPDCPVCAAAAAASPSGTRSPASFTAPPPAPVPAADRPAFPPASYDDSWTIPPADASTATPATDPAGPAVPMSVAGYEVLGELGRGGMGVVYKARQAGLKRVVALKMILTGGHAGEHERGRFRLEAEAVARLRHPNIVQVYEVGEHDGNPFLSLEYCEGGSLAQQIGGRPQPPAPAARLVEAVARAVHHAHQRGVVHRDLKPANILLTSGGREPPVLDEQTVAREPGTGDPRPPLADAVPKVSDFGLAKHLDHAAGRTLSGEILGTPSYMAPEQAAGRVKDVGPATDVYALGAILYECLTGRPPFKTATALDTILQVQNQDPVPPSRLRPQVPRDLELIALKAMAKEPARRYATADDLADDLARWRGGQPVKARAPTLVYVLSKFVRRHRFALTVTAAVAGALVAGAAAWYFDRARGVAEAARRQAHDRAEAERIGREQAAAAYRQGDGFFAKEDYDRAIDRYTEAIRLDSAEAEYLYARGLAYHNRGIDRDDRDDYARAVDDLTAAIHLDPAQASYYHDRGNSFYMLHDYDRAVADYSAAIRLDPADPEFFNDRGDAYFGKKAYREAVADFGEAIRLKPAAADYHGNRGWSYLRLQDYDRAVADLTAALDRAPNQAKYFNLRGVAYHGKRDYARAVADYTAAIRLNPRDAAHHDNRGNSHFAAGEYSLAVVDYTAAIRLRPNQAGYYNNRGRAFLNQQEIDRAVADFGEAVRLAPTSALYRSNRGIAYRRAGDYARAAADQEKALRLDRKFSPAYNGLAWLRATCPDAGFRDGRKAVELATRACELTAWKDRQLIATLAAAHAEAGDFEAAVRRQKEALKLGEGQPAGEREKAQARLRLYEDGEAVPGR